jgi:hypothetical protein
VKDLAHKGFGPDRATALRLNVITQTVVRSRERFHGR